MASQMSHLELAALRDEFKSGLSDLTQNVRPLIHALTTVAQENEQAAPIIVQAIEERIRTAPAPQKLPSLYLIDSICKLVGPPYPTLFARNIVPVFSAAYASVDQDTRDRMERMIGTWGAQANGSGGNPPQQTVFPKEVLTRLNGVVKGFKDAERREQQNFVWGTDAAFGARGATHGRGGGNYELGTRHSNWDNTGAPSYDTNWDAGLPGLDNSDYNRRSPSRSPTPPAFRSFANRTTPPPPSPPMGNRDVSGTPVVGSIRQGGRDTATMANGSMSVSNAIGVAAAALGAGSAKRMQRYGGTISSRMELPPQTSSSFSLPLMAASSSTSVHSSFNNNTGMTPTVDTRLLDLELRALLNAKRAMASSYGPSASSGIEGNQLAALEGLNSLVQSNTLDNASLVTVATQVHSLFIATFPAAASSVVNPVQMIPQVQTPSAQSVNSLPGLDVMASTFSIPGIPPPMTLGGGVPIGLTGPSAPVLGLNAPTMTPMQGSTGSATAELQPGVWPAIRGLTPDIDDDFTGKFKKDGKALPGKEHYQIRLTSEDINRRRDPPPYHLLYQILSIQCRQCGFRFPPSDDGKHRYSAHLDWHFRQNRRLREKTRKIVGRDWFLPEEDWVNTREVAAVEDKNPFEGAPGAGAVIASDDSGFKEPPPPPPSIISPEDDTVIAGGCPICGEKLEKYWDEDAEAWMIRNAVWADGKVVHATCNADRLTRLMQSNRETPDRVPAPGGVKPETAGIGVLGKRKADYSEGVVKKERV
ncbi:hypothetical protein M427DRAFT_52952 [Gonapodya prolifera JEL478]|uniref:CID domain-containing protein n=1 Tax=Gonapodya prolifera (strain JEL478) TaxID=1344416 RepID=A0A139AS10_GONPJ|nr:hypothetical protein M427DRAFT_52952 [Gonapodya prolifera JEL478]|eukprot:KXS19541.1 hypothetical protein M427DRAFT_52952 [Gonapodya prolifera JEL478]